MPGEALIPDQEARTRALDIAQSFSVRAPAGSGKTGLLTQRILKLLGTVDRPEAILAITFTRKAAAEMRNRIFETLEQANNPEPSPNGHSKHEIQGLELAKLALNQNEKHGWNLLKNPNRLRIQTIDSLCRRLAINLPLESGVSLPPGVADDVGLLYQTAARRTLQHLESDHPVAEDLEFLLRHLSVGIEQLKDLIAGLLVSRDSWLPLLSKQNLAKRWLEEALDSLIQEKFDDARQELQPFVDQLGDLLNYALSQGGDALEPELDSNILSQSVDSTERELGAWQALANFLLQRGKAQALKTVNKNRGFSAGDPRKNEMHELLGNIAEQPALVRHLHSIRGLPQPGVSREQWNLIQALTRVLTICAAELRLLEQEIGLCDHTEIAIAALRALGEPDHPTPLAEKLDYRIQHILVDEFQDTSSTQVHLLECLTAGWQPDDGRTLFVVGDAMQSIYEFRKANVELFQRITSQGLGDIQLQPLTLYSNFRSRPGLVAKINQVFSETLGTVDSVQQGFSQASAIRDDNQKKSLNFGCHTNDREEAEAIAQYIKTLMSRGESDIAVLVRNRNHLSEILPALREHQIPWQAQDIEPLKERMAVLDVDSLTRAICCPGDRVAWLALLRTPWVGLDNSDLLVIADWSEKEDLSIFDTLASSAALNSVSIAGKAALQRLESVLRSALAHFGQIPLRWVIEQSWLDLGGPEGLLNAFDLGNVQDYLNLLESIESGGTIADWEAFDLALKKLYARPIADGDTRVQIMTMHKAKGLEFDHVILPALAKTSSAGGPSPLLVWWEREFRDGQLRFLLSPKAAKSSDNSLYSYLLEEQKERQLQEQMRILYVAMTRAKESVWMSACFQFDEDSQPRPPSRNSLLYGLWPQLKPEFDSRAPAQITTDTPTTIRELSTLRRLPTERNSHVSLSEVEPTHVTDSGSGFLSRYISRCIGDLLHEDLQTLHNNFANPDLISQLSETWQQRLSIRGLTPEQISDTTSRLEKAINLLRQSATAKWIFQQREDSAAEQGYAVGTKSGQIKRLIVDRTFVDSGKRWVIDYKTAEPEMNEDRESFIQNQLAHYRNQLMSYEKIFEDYPVVTALYFPLLDELRELDR